MTVVRAAAHCAVLVVWPVTQHSASTVGLVLSSPCKRGVCDCGEGGCALCCAGSVASNTALSQHCGSQRCCPLPASAGRFVRRLTRINFQLISHFFHPRVCSRAACAHTDDVVLLCVRYRAEKSLNPVGGGGRESWAGLRGLWVGIQGQGRALRLWFGLDTHSLNELHYLPHPTRLLQASTGVALHACPACRDRWACINGIRLAERARRALPSYPDAPMRGRLVNGQGISTTPVLP